MPHTDSRKSALIETALVVSAGSALHASLQALGAPIAISAIGTLVVLALCTWLLRRRGKSWADLGFGRLMHWRNTAAWSLGLFLVQMLAPALITKPLADALGLPPQRLDAFVNLKGNLGLYLVMLIPVGWGAAAFGEELTCRGFIFNRLMHAFGGKPAGVAAALLIQAMLFALGHLYLGPRGMLNAGAVGFISGAAYIANGRNLWPLIFAHGLIDSVGLTLLYLGAGHG